MKKECSKLFVFSLLAFYLMLFIMPIVSAQESYVIEDVANNAAVRVIFGNPGESLEGYQGIVPDAGLSRTSAIVIHFAMFAMLLVVFSDIFGGFMPLSNKVTPWVLGSGLTIVAAQLGFIPWIVITLGSITAGLGIFAVWASMVIAFGMFVAATWGGGMLKNLMLRKESKQASVAIQEATKQLGDLAKSREKLAKQFS